MTHNLLDGPAIPVPSPSDLDELMSRDPIDLSAADIDAIIAMQRQYRARKESGGGRVKRDPNAPKQSLSLADLGLAKPKAPAPQPAPGSVPAVVSTFRRRL